MLVKPAKLLAAAGPAANAAATTQAVPINFVLLDIAISFVSTRTRFSPYSYGKRPLWRRRSDSPNRALNIFTPWAVTPLMFGNGRYSAFQAIPLRGVTSMQHGGIRCRRTHYGRANRRGGGA